MGLFKKNGEPEDEPEPSTSSVDPAKEKAAMKKSIIDYVTSKKPRVSEATLQVWRNLPGEIRQDPSMINFQREAERWKAEHSDVTSISGRSVSFNDEIELEDRSKLKKREAEEDSDDDSDGDQFISIKVTNPEGATDEDKIEEQPPKPVKVKKSVHMKEPTPPRLEESQEVIHYGQPNHHAKVESPFHEFGKTFFLVFIWGVMIAFLAATPEKKLPKRQLVLPINAPKYYNFPEQPSGNLIHVMLQAPFLPDPRMYIKRDKNKAVIDTRNKDNTLVIFLQTINGSYVSPNKTYLIHKYDDFDRVSPSKVEFTLELNDEVEIEEDDVFQAVIVSNFSKSPPEEVKEVPITFSVDFTPINKVVGVLFAAFTLILLYALIVWDMVHRTFAAIIASTLSIALLAALGDRPTHEEIMSWIDVETILLLFSMMILVGILTETGVFDHLAVYAYRITKGEIWPLIHCLCIITCVMSMLLDNVTTILLMAPITITLCEDLDLNPVPILMAIVVHANIGGIATPIGDPPNIIITSNHTFLESGINFLTFTMHCLIGVVIVTITTNIHLRLIYPNINSLFIHEPKDVKMLKKSILTWERTLRNSISPFSKDADMIRETLIKKIKSLRHELKKKSTRGVVETKLYKTTLEEMEKAYPIKNVGLLIKSAIALVFILVLFFVQSIPEFRKLSLGWSALIGVIFLLIISERDDMDAILHRVEWPTLLFFAASFVLMEAVERMGFIGWIGTGTETIIKGVSKDYRLAFALIVIIWVSALSSAFVESLPVTQMMVKIVVSLNANTKLALPLQPLVWAIAFGPALGGNATLVGASANIICAGIADQHGYQMTFMDFLKFGFPITLVSVAVSNGYLLFFHAFLEWH